MSNPSSAPDPASDERARVTQQIAGRLRARGVHVDDTESSDDVGSLLETVERFEAAVEARGGDLMVDEAPEGKEAEPDNPDFVLPVRRDRESIADYIGRIDSATRSLRR